MAGGDRSIGEGKIESLDIYREGHVGTPGRFAYLSTEAHPGTVVELSDNSGPKGRMFEHIAEAARDWDGREPIRIVWPMGES